MQEIIDVGTFKLVALGLVFFVLALPIIVSRGFRGVLIMVASLSAAVYTHEHWQNLKYSGLVFFSLLLILCLFFRPQH
ncbi:hypothetical protein [Aquella oligotrophica]|uniref:Uncharacterized protein n=1 Tax=Aquella oligotrophica TaxID=2067065 RepID=A0A2I7N989_9NEIS|nr:hypothetical protein [Aquella oligotrophica]AUR53017.1 hypothetical protein CUN60_12180 [Aquella oligotrophica]